MLTDLFSFAAIIDNSGSMNDYNRLDIAKEAAITVISTLTVADRVAVVAFSDAAYKIGGHDTLLRATRENKEMLIENVRNLKANGATNFYDAFDAIFNALDRTIASEATSGCNVAILFLTDGVITAGQSDDQVINMVRQRTNYLETYLDRKTAVFTFR